MKTDEQLEELQEFYNQIAYSFVIFDPLDRPIPEDDDQATKRDEMLEMIEELPYMQGNDLSVPLSNKLYSQLEKMISAEQIKCIAEVETFVEEAKE